LAWGDGEEVVREGGIDLGGLEEAYKDRFLGGETVCNAKRTGLTCLYVDGDGCSCGCVICSELCLYYRFSRKGDVTIYAV